MSFNIFTTIVEFLFQTYLDLLWLFSYFGDEFQVYQESVIKNSPFHNHSVFLSLNEQLFCKPKQVTFLL